MAEESPLVLIVDDEKMMRLQIRYALEQKGYRVIEANDGNQGLVVYLETFPDIVLLDAMMPEADGFSFCQSLESILKTDRVPVLMITGLDDKNSIDRAFALGATDYVTKPIHWTLLLQRVNRLIQQARLQKQLEEVNQNLEDRVRQRTEDLKHTVENLLKEIRDRQQAELALWESREKLRLALDAVQMGTWDWNILTDKMVWSESLETLIGVEPNSYGSSFSTFLSYVHDEDRQILNEAIRISRSEHSVFQLQYRVIWQNQSIHWLESKGSFFYDAKGNPIRMIGTFIDITERKQNELELRKMAALVENSNDFIGVTHMEGEHKVLYVNSAGRQLVGLESMETSQINALDYHSDEDKVFIQKHIFPTLLKKGSWQGELSFRHFQTGEIIPVLASCFLVHDQQLGQTMNCAIVARDIRERKQAEQKVLESLEKEKQLSELKSKFIETVSHEFRTPLASISLAAELLERKGNDWEPEKSLVRYQRIHDSVKRMTRVLEDALTITKITNEELKFSPTHFDLAEFCQNIIDELHPDTENNHIVNFAVEGQSPFLIGLDRNLLQQTLTQLLLNAIRYSLSSKSILFKLIYEPDVVVFQIEDRGIGIPEDEQSRVFEKFYRATSSSSIPGMVGAGLGLAIVQKAVEIQGGTIDLQSQVNQGTTVTVKLPYQPPQLKENP